MLLYLLLRAEHVDLTDFMIAEECPSVDSLTHGLGCAQIVLGWEAQAVQLSLWPS